MSRAAYRAQRGRCSRSSGGSRCPEPRPLQRAKSLPPHGPGASAWSWFLQQARGPLERDSCAEKKKPRTSLKGGGGEKGGTRRGRGLYSPPRLHLPCHAPCHAPSPRPALGHALYLRPHFCSWCLMSLPLSTFFRLAPPQPRPFPHHAPLLSCRVLGFPGLSAAGRPRALSAQSSEAGPDCDFASSVAPGTTFLRRWCRLSPGLCSKSFDPSGGVFGKGWA